MRTILTSDRADHAIAQNVEAHDRDRKVALGQPFADDREYFLPAQVPPLEITIQPATHILEISAVERVAGFPTQVASFLFVHRS